MPVLKRESLQELVRTRLGDRLFVVVSNREPYIHTHVGSEIRCHVPASGLTVALDPVMRACGGTWVAFGSGEAIIKRRTPIPRQDAARC